MAYSSNKHWLSHTVSGVRNLEQLDWEVWFSLSWNFSRGVGWYLLGMEGLFPGWHIHKAVGRRPPLVLPCPLHKAIGASLWQAAGFSQSKWSKRARQKLQCLSGPTLGSATALFRVSCGCGGWPYSMWEGAHRVLPVMRQGPPEAIFRRAVTTSPFNDGGGSRGNLLSRY